MLVPERHQKIREHEQERPPGQRRLRLRQEVERTCEIVLGGAERAAEHWFGQAIGRFSRTYEITGGDAWTAAFVLMALAMVVTRVLVTMAQAFRLEPGRPALVP